MAGEKRDIEVGDKVVFERTEDGWQASVQFKGGGLLGKPVKTYATFEEAAADIAEMSNLDG